MRPADTTRFLRALPATEAPPRAVLRFVADRVVDAGGHPYAMPTSWAAATHPADVGPSDLSLSPEEATPWLLGQAREVLHGRAARTALGAWFTPQATARHMVAMMAEGRSPRTVLDPSCGGGAFLLAAHERFPDARVVGMDIDPLAVETTRVALDLAGCVDHEIHLADGLTGPDHERVDLVVGNPPFLSQLAGATARSHDRRRELTGRFGTRATRYVDDAALFVLRTARDLLAPGGEAVLVVPEAMLATADAAALREEVMQHCTVEVVWRDTARVFPGTPTCAIRLRRHRRSTPVPTITSSPGTTWSRLLADQVPEVVLGTDAVLGDLATATADFRQAYYLLAEHVQEQDGPGEGQPRAGGPPVEGSPRVVPVGLIDPAHLRWGESPVRFAKRAWQRPVAVGLPQDFLLRRLGPKVLVATQTKVLESLVDEDGSLLPSTPVITLRAADLWHVGAALTNPVATAVAAREHAGAALTRSALKLSARQLLALPVPDRPSPAWDEAADAYRRAHDAHGPEERRALLSRCGSSMMAAHGVDDPGLLAWWLDRLPTRAEDRAGPRR